MRTDSAKKTHYGVNPISAGYTEKQKYLALHHGWPLPKKRQFLGLGAHWSRPGRTNGGAGTAAAQLASILVADPRSRNSPIIFAIHKRPQQQVSYGSKRIAKLGVRETIRKPIPEDELFSSTNESL